MFMKKGNLLLDAGIVGLALFATIFGAGNLVFPPILGLTAGTGFRRPWGSFFRESFFRFWEHGR